MNKIIDFFKKLIGSSKNKCYATDDLFILGGYAPRLSRDDDPPEGGRIEEMADDHFTVVGPYYARTDWGDNWMFEQAEDCREHDMCLAYTIQPKVNCHDDPDEHCLEYEAEHYRRVELELGDVPSESEMDDDTFLAHLNDWIEDVEEQVSRAIEDPEVNERIAIWVIQPEEMRHWIGREMQLLRRMYEKIRETDPLERPIMMHEPGRSSVERLVAHIPYQDILSVGIYPHFAGNTHNRLQVRHAMTVMMQAIGCLKPGPTALPVPTLEMWDADEPFEEAHPGEAYPLGPADIPRFVTHDAYCAFANGAQGFFIWSMGKRPATAERPPFTITYSDYYNAWAEVTKKLHDWQLKEVILKGRVLDGISAVVTAGEENIRFFWPHPEDEEKNIDETYHSLSLRAWAYRLNTYILAVNSSEEPVEFMLNGMPNGTYEELFTEVNYTTSDGSISLSLPALGVLLLKGGNRGCIF